jgi:hypothetical protein
LRIFDKVELNTDENPVRGPEKPILSGAKDIVIPRFPFFGIDVFPEFVGSGCGGYITGIAEAHWDC